MPIKESVPSLLRSHQRQDAGASCGFRSSDAIHNAPPLAVTAKSVVVS
jgi:hypothetical protein